MPLCVPIYKIYDVTATERTRPVSVRRFLLRSMAKQLSPFFLSSEPIGIHVSVTRLVSHQFHEPLRRSAFHFEHHRALQRTQPLVDEKKRNENRRDTDRYEPFIANVTWRMKHQALYRKLVVKLPNKWFECRALKLQGERGNAAFE